MALTELLVTKALEAVVGSAFSELTKRMMRESPGVSDHELLKRIMSEILRINGENGEIRTRLAFLEQAVESIRSSVPATVVVMHHAAAKAVGDSSTTVAATSLPLDPGARVLKTVVKPPTIKFVKYPALKFER